MNDSQPLEYSTRTEAAYARLRDDILSGELKPGEKLRLERLRDSYGFGLSSIREALSKLSSEQLVGTTGQRGYWVEPISREEFDDITNMRLFIEPEAVERSIANATLDWEAQFVAAYHRLVGVEKSLDAMRETASAAWERENRNFHHRLIVNCGSDWMLRFVATLIEQSERYRRQAVRLNAIPQEILQAEHRAIYDAALARNGRLAAELLRVHISNSAKSLAAALF
ncbi:MAG: transcriptional regulator [Pseudooceanicola sp.]|jgi:DNA-binding GntR family transcriptional regulator|nr:transcriptional regulator [Pseudooceanicola sp.]